LVDLKAIAASTRASATAPVVSAAELSGVVPRRDSVVGARVTESGGIPPWFYGVIGCLSVMALGLGIFWYLDAPTKHPRLAEAAAERPFVPAAPQVTPAGPEIVPLPTAAPPAPIAPVEPAHAEKEKAAHHVGAAKSVARAAAAQDEAPADSVDVTLKKPSVLDTLLSPGTAAANGDDGSGNSNKRDPRPAGAAATGETDRTLKDVDAALDDLQPKVHECFRRFQIRGTAQVKMTVSPTGSVESPALTGDFEGTPTGDCVIKELASAALPPFKGGPVSVSHAFIFR
jgi:hypothetical protein